MKNRKLKPLKKLPKKLAEKGITLTLLNKARKEGGIALKESKQHGKSRLVADARKTAKAPGKRLSRNGNIYWESRKNRSDRKGKGI